MRFNVLKIEDSLDPSGNRGSDVHTPRQQLPSKGKRPNIETFENFAPLFSMPIEAATNFQFRGKFRDAHSHDS